MKDYPNGVGCVVCKYDIYGIEGEWIGVEDSLSLDDDSVFIQPFRFGSWTYCVEDLEKYNIKGRFEPIDNSAVPLTDYRRFSRQKRI